MGSVSFIVMQMFVSCVHLVAVLNAAFCMTCIITERRDIYGQYEVPLSVSLLGLGWGLC